MRMNSECEKSKIRVSKGDRISLDEFDAICDEFLKAFERSDVAGKGLIDELGFLAVQAILGGENVIALRRDDRPALNTKKILADGVSLNEQTSAPVVTLAAQETHNVTVDQNSLMPKGRRGGTVTRVAQSLANPLPTGLSPLAQRLFDTKRRQLLALSFQQVRVSEPGVMEADELLSAIGLSNAKACLMGAPALDISTSDGLHPNGTESDGLPDAHHVLMAPSAHLCEV